MASCPVILTLVWTLASRSHDAQPFPGTLPPAANTCGRTWHCGGTSLWYPPSSSVWGEAAALLLARRGFSPAGEAGSSSLLHCPGQVSLVASVCKKGGGSAGGSSRTRMLAQARPRHARWAQSNPPASSQQGTGHHQWRMDLLLHNKYYCELSAWNYHRGARPCCAWCCANSEVFL